MNKKPTVLEHPYVFIVLEFTEEGGFVHGVYANWDEADGKRLTVLRKNRDSANYVAVLKKPIQGKKPKIIRSWTSITNKQSHIFREEY